MARKHGTAYQFSVTTKSAEKGLVQGHSGIVGWGMSLCPQNKHAVIIRNVSGYVSVRIVGIAIGIRKITSVIIPAPCPVTMMGVMVCTIRIVKANDSGCIVASRKAAGVSVSTVRNYVAQGLGVA